MIQLSKEMRITKQKLLEMSDMFFTHEWFNPQVKDDLYLAVGKITAEAQEWEILYKEYVKQFSDDKDKVEKMSLIKLNERTIGKNKINKNNFLDLKFIARVRNYINHYFFVDDFPKIECNGGMIKTDYNQEKIILNNAYSLIMEANDFIRNQLKESDVHIPTILDFRN